jgi:hypothetical protein
VNAPAPTLLVAGDPAQARDAWAAALGAAACDLSELPARLGGDPALQVVVFYLAPWEAFLGTCGTDAGSDLGEAGRARLRQWQAGVDAALAAAARWPNRVRLVNAGRLASRENALAQALAADGWAAPVEAPLADAQLPVGTALLARLFEEHAPAHWDLYESLESMALLLGREAEFRGADPGDADLLAEAMRVWGGAVVARLDAVRAHEAVGRSEAERADIDGRRGDAEASRQTLERALEDRETFIAQQASENELLLEHVAQLRQELADQAQANAALRDTVVRLTQAADDARRLISG